MYSSAARLSAGRGAGIVTHAPLLEALKNIGVALDDLGVPIDTRTGCNVQGEVIRSDNMAQNVTPLDRRLHTLTRTQVANVHVHLSHTLMNKISTLSC